MFEWAGLKEQIREFVDCLHGLLEKQGVKAPNWDPSELADAVIAGLQKVLKGDPSLAEEPEHLSSKALDLVRLEMAKRLDWGTIRSNLLGFLIHRWALLLQDAEDLVDSSIAEALEKWDPFCEKAWSRPGFGLARGILDNLVKKYFRATKERKSVEDGLARNPVRGNDNKEETRIDGDKLTALIDSWLDAHLDLPTATAFRLDIVYDVPHEFCGMIADSRWADPAGARAFWWRKTTEEIRPELSKYLRDNGYE